MPKTKIICTIGPASASENVIRKMVSGGMDVARLNFSHGTHDVMRRYIDAVRRVNRVSRSRIKIMQDLEGFRIRVGDLKGHRPIEIKKGARLWLAQDERPGSGDTVTFDYDGSLSDIRIGQHIYIDDGNIALIVKGRKAGLLKTEVMVGGILKEHKGINLPGARLHFSGMTDKDKRDIRFGAENGVDYVAQSFVRSAKDVQAVRKEVLGSGGSCAIIAKIETREGIRNIDDIIDASDGIMIARGDMGVSIPVYEVPIVQKMIIKKCNRKRKFVITATQMLESMVENIRPTRAEVADVANAILDGTDFVMLSAESAVGRYPAETVWMMDQIIRFTERSMRASKR